MTSGAIDFSASLLVALTASLHCVGMCGGFAAASAPRPGTEPRPRLGAAGKSFAWAQALYHAGKLSSYLFLGACAALLGAGGSRIGPWPGRILTGVAGALLVACGLKALGLVPVRPHIVSLGEGRAPIWTRAARAWASLGTRLLALKGPSRPLLLGAFSGLLPCPLAYAFVARSAAATSPLEAITTMAALGLGTAPALSVVAAVGQGAAFRRWGPAARAWGGLLVALGGWTIIRGFSPAPCCG